MARNNTLIVIGLAAVLLVAGLAYMYLPVTDDSDDTTTTTTTTTDVMEELEDQLTIYSTVDPEDFEGWQQAFNEKYPDVTINYVQGWPGAIYSRMVSERDAGEPTADVVMISLSLQLVLQEEGYFDVYESPEAAAYPDLFKDPNGYWTTVVILPMLQVYNTDLVSEMDVPTTIEKVVDTKWKGKATIHDLTLGTVGTQYFGSMKEPMGEMAWESFIERLATNVEPIRSPSFEGIISPVAAGEQSIALNVYMHDFLSWKNNGAPVESFTIDELPVLTTLLPVSLVKDAENPIAAQRFIDFILSEQGQEIVGNTEVRIAARPGITATYTLATVLPGKTPDDLSIFPNEDVRRNTDIYKNYFIEQFAD